MKSTLYLPDGVEDLLHPDAWRFENFRRKVLDLFVHWGYQYVEPPVVEYLDALLIASGDDLDLPKTALSLAMLKITVQLDRKTFNHEK